MTLWLEKVLFYKQRRDALLEKVTTDYWKCSILIRYGLICVFFC